MKGPVGLEESRYWHGGAPGLQKGELVVPHAPNFVDGCPICLAKKNGESPVLDPASKNPDRVYITTDREYARFYASKFPAGDLYRVEPVGELVLSSEDRFETFVVEAARVTGIVDRGVRLTEKQRRSLLNRWTRRDRHVAPETFLGRIAL